MGNLSVYGIHYVDVIRIAQSSLVSRIVKSMLRYVLMHVQQHIHSQFFVLLLVQLLNGTIVVENHLLAFVRRTQLLSQHVLCHFTCGRGSFHLT